ncbi:MAG: HEAT repeat domain-containing protein [Deltaproteobacteria bacterium]|nr:HEAT repeat domain-containing protein [Deltaproteobacteria bacterium]
MRHRWSPSIAVLAIVIAGTAHAEWPLIPSSQAVRDLSGRDPSVRIRGADALAWEPRSDWVVALLVERLRTETDPLAMSAMLRTLAIHGTPPARDLVLATALDRRKRGAAVPALGVLARSRHDPLARAAGASALVTILLDAPNEDVLEALPPDADVSVGPLLSALARPASTAWAVRALGRLRDPRATPALAALLDAADPSTRFHAVEALGAIGDVRAAAALAARLADRDSDLALAAAHALETCVDRGVSAQVVAASRDPRMRPATFGVLARIDRTDAREALESFASSPSPGERRAALAALALRGDPASATRLERVATSGHPRARPLAIAALADLRDRAGRPALERVARIPGTDGDLAIRAMAAAAFERGEHDSDVIARARSRPGLASAISAALAGDPDAGRGLLRRLGSRDVAVRRMVATAVAAVAPPDCDAPVTRAIARESDADARRALAVAAMRCGSRAARPWLTRFVSERDPAAPEAALALASADVITEDARRALRMALLDEEPRTRVSAALALGELRDGRASHHLARMLRRDDDARVRAAAARSLGLVASARHAAALRAARILDHDTNVRARADDAWRLRTGQRAGAVYSRGRTLLRVRAVDASGRPLVDAVADVTLPDGRRVRLATDPLGDVLFGGTVSGDAVVEVAPRVAPAPPPAPPIIRAAPPPAADAGAPPSPSQP